MLIFKRVLTFMMLYIVCYALFYVFFTVLYEVLFEKENLDYISSRLWICSNYQKRFDDSYIKEDKKDEYI
jgi:hypothetical protein